MQYKRILLTALMTAAAFLAAAQNQGPYTGWGNSHASSPLVCDSNYMWPTNGILVPCPEVQVKQKHDHTPLPQYRAGARPWSNNPNDKGWDTVITCKTPNGITLSCMPYIPVQYFEGYYTVDTIPFDPADTTFYLGDVPPSQRQQQPISSDDRFAASPVVFGDIFPFFFFGKQKTQFRLGDNGIVTFCSTSDYGSDSPSDANACPWSYNTSNQLPWTSSNTPTYSGSCFNRMHDAILGVYEDTYTGSGGVYMVGPHDGIYFGVVGEWPCRKIIATWNNIPMYNDSTKRQTYQMVCYEGSNIIEIHIKKRNTHSWQNGVGIIGIQNATGLPQTKGSFSETTRSVYAGAPSAFFPADRNVFTTAITRKAYRFTPQGSTQRQYEWFRILDIYDSVTNTYTTDTVQLRNVVNDPSAADDTNGFFYPMGQVSTCPTLSRAVVNPHCISRYVFHLKFQDANNTWYNLYDTVVIGIDTTAELSIRAKDSTSSVKTLNICAGSPADLKLEFPKMQVIDTITYSVIRRSNGQNIELPASQCLELEEVTEDPNNSTLTSQNLKLLATLPDQGVMENKIDSVFVQTYIQFTSGCQNYDTILVNIYPNFDTTVVEGICQGESYLWSANNQVYTTSTRADKVLQSTPGCDSTVHLDLTVYDKSYTVQHVTDCRPYTWINGNTYYTSNSATAASDTILLKNSWDCDSTVQLEFTYLPVTAHIQSDRDFFDFEHLDAVLTDVSENNDSRTWILPGGTTLSGPVAYYTMPAEYDEADIQLLASATYDGHTCVDTTNIIIPMRKETFWLPNIFTPESAHGNNLFGSTSTRTLREEMYIYNRIGQLVFQCDSPDCKWDGRDLNGNPCPQGTYTYLIRYANEFLPKVTHVIHGTVTLIR